MQYSYKIATLVQHPNVPR